VSDIKLQKALRDATREPSIENLSKLGMSYLRHTDYETANSSYLDLLNNIANRPAMWVGNTDFFKVATFLDGYDFAIGKTLGDLTLAPGHYFVMWLKTNFLIEHPAWGWQRIVYHLAGHNHSTAISRLPILFNMYLTAINQMSTKTLEQTYSNLDQDLEQLGSRALLCGCPGWNA